LVWSPVRSVVGVGWLVVGAVRVDLVGALVGASVAVFLMRIFGATMENCSSEAFGFKNL